jgi:hypothetical protein
MNNYLYNIPTSISQVGDEYHIIYTIQDGNYTIVGGCNYKEWKQRSKLQTTPVYLLTQVYMMDIISYINEKSPLNDGDLTTLQMEIRTDSLNKLKDYLSSGSTSHI